MDKTKTMSVWLRTRASLLARLKGADSEPAWDEFYDMYWRAIYGYALHFGVHPQHAGDIVQEVFVKIFRNMPSFEYDRTRGRFLTWVKTVTRNTVMDHGLFTKPSFPGWACEPLPVGCRGDGFRCPWRYRSRSWSSIFASGRAISIP